MALFHKLDSPVFLKDDSDTAEYIECLKGFSERVDRGLKANIEKEIKLAAIGEAGEKNIAFELRNSGLPMYILHNVYIETEDLSAQIDYIVVTRHITFIIECKNLIGNIEIDNDGNFIRSYELNGKKFREGVYSPITQNQRHMEVLRRICKEAKGSILSKYLFDKNFSENYKSIVVLANSKTILEARYAKKEVKETVIRADQLIGYMKDALACSKTYELSEKEMKNLAEQFLAFHKPRKPENIKKYEELLSSEKQQEAQTEPCRKTPSAEGEQDYAELVKRLKAFRLSKSREENIKPYFIFNDRQMEDLIAKMPLTVDKLQYVKGFGSVKAEKYGKDIFNIIRDFQ